MQGPLAGPLPKPYGSRLLGLLLGGLLGDLGGLPKNQSMACEARHAPTGLRAGRAPLVEVWKFRGLEAWSLHSASPVARLSRVLFSVAVEGLARCACTLCSPGRFSAPWSFVSLAVEGLALWACTVISKNNLAVLPAVAAARLCVPLLPSVSLCVLP